MWAMFNSCSVILSCVLLSCVHVVVHYKCQQTEASPDRLADPRERTQKANAKTERKTPAAPVA